MTTVAEKFGHMALEKIMPLAANTPNRLRAALFAGCGAVVLGACAAGGGMAGPGMSSNAPQGQPGVPYSGVRPDPQNQAVLDAMTKRLGLRPPHTLTPQQARLQPTFADGVKEVLRQQGRPTTPPPGVSARDISVSGATGPINAKVYTPDGARGPLPVIVFYDGGGWVLANSQVYDASTRALAREAQTVVVSVDYRLAPEAKFPAQHDDSFAAYRWVLANAASIGGDPARVALAGESAGGNLAVATAMAARDAGVRAPLHVLSIYPIAGSDLNTPSYRENSNALPLGRALMAWFFHHTARTPADALDPRINLVSSNLRNLPPTTIIAAQIDPLRSEGQVLHDRLRAAGVAVSRREYAGVTHEFFGADAVIPDALAAQRFGGERLRAAFARR